MGDGGQKPIDQVKVGESVLATDPLTDQTAARTVENVIYTPDDQDFTDLRIQSDNGNGSLTATDHHPFWVEKDQKWVDAADLHNGDTLRTPNGADATVSEATQRKGLDAAFNLTVEGFHTYYVLAGDAPVLVHNDVDCFAPFTTDNVGAIARKAGLKTRSDGDETAGFARVGKKIIDDLASGRKKDEAELVAWVKAATKELTGRVSGRASDLEVKWVARMHLEGIDEADLVINYETGPCMQQFGCNDVLDMLLLKDEKKPKGLTVWFPMPGGVWKCKGYGTHKGRCAD
ncbi:polymorphic toxin-type HINT domain-containing protein [Kitasatospora sp. NPDC004799]|uniref:polymorphic toxin-type HINT domain-containing protein n=1 Tax=Kitasatospora sp. NPDC004799 TaxID=3154460 RepID=UPI0033B8AC0B